MYAPTQPTLTIQIHLKYIMYEPTQPTLTTQIHLKTRTKNPLYLNSIKHNHKISIPILLYGRE